MKTPRMVQGLLALGAIAVLTLQFQNCAQPNNISPQDVASTSSANTNSTDLSLSASPASISLNGTSMVSASGGTQPYTFSVSQGTGTVDQSGLVHAGNVAGVIVVMVKDSQSHTSFTSIVVNSSSTTLPSTSPTLAQVYRFYNTKTGEHFLTLSYNEGANAGYTFEFPAFNVFSANPPAATIVLYRCYAALAGNHFASLDPKCEGMTTESAYGYVYATQVNGSKPLYRYYNRVSGDHLITVTANEGGANYQYESTLGYVPN